MPSIFLTKREARRPAMFQAVRLRTSQLCGGVAVPAGTRGVVIDTYDDGSYGVEISKPVEEVLIIDGKDLDPV